MSKGNLKFFFLLEWPYEYGVSQHVKVVVRLDHDQLDWMVSSKELLTGIQLLKRVRDDIGPNEILSACKRLTSATGAALEKRKEVSDDDA